MLPEKIAKSDDDDELTLTKGLQGTIKEIDEDGDAMIDFGLATVLYVG